jgi:two-component system, OmpR family, alkaline phosphatase synthesis response regulator PhoP
MKLLLVVDDEYTIVATLADLLREEGYDVLTAHNGRQALDLLSTSKPVCCLVDLMMPVMGGAQLIAAMRADPTLATIPVILMSAVAREEHLEMHKVAAIMRKPFGLSKLLEVLETVIGTSSPR